MKRYFSILSVFILIVSFALTAYSFKIDGAVGSVEWEKADSAVIFSGDESNNNVSFGSYMWFVDENDLFLYFNFIDNNLLPDNQNAGVALQIENSEFYIFTPLDYENYDSDKYRIEGAMQIDITNGASCEIRVGFKYGVPEEINGKVRFIDSNGSYSNVYDISIKNRTYDNDYVYEYYEPETTKQTTIKSENTTITQTKKAEKTTNKKNENQFNLLDFLISDETTTQVKSTKATKSTTRKSSSKTTKMPKTSVKIVEKEVYVTISQAVSNQDVKKDDVVSDEITTSKTEMTTSEGKKYQMITAAGGLAVLLTIAVIGTVGANKKAHKEEEEKEKENK